MKRQRGRLRHNLSFVLMPRRKPGLLFHLAASMLRHRAGDWPLRNVDVALDYGCNLTCVHCSCATLRGTSRGRMTPEEYGVLARELYALGTIYVSFTGGEPTLPKANLEGILPEFPTRRMLVGLQTNAMLIDEGSAARYRSLGVDVLQVSMDGMDPEKHDSFRRRPGAQEKVFHNIDIARRHGFKIILCTSVTRESVHEPDLERLLQYSEDAGLPVVVSIPCPSGNWQGCEDMLLGDRERERLDDLLEKFPGFRRDFHSNYSKLGCSAGSEKLYITPTGEVMPCPFIHVSFGNVRDEPLARIRKRMLTYERFVEYAPHCLAGEDTGFFRDVMRPALDGHRLPVPVDEHPHLGHLMDEVPFQARC